MLPSNRTDALAQEAKSNEGGPDHVAPDQSVLMELRKDLAAIVTDLAKVVEHRSAQARAGTAGGIDAASMLIRSHPVASVAVAVVLGAGVAVTVLPPRRTLRASDWPLPGMPAAFVQTIRDLPSSVASSSTLSSLASAFERVVEQIAAVDPKSSLTPALERAGTWFNGLRTSMGAK